MGESPHPGQVRGMAPAGESPFPPAVLLATAPRDLSIKRRREPVKPLLRRPRHPIFHARGGEGRFGLYVNARGASVRGSLIPALKKTSETARRRGPRLPSRRTPPDGFAAIYGSCRTRIVPLLPEIWPCGVGRPLYIQAPQAEALRNLLIPMRRSGIIHAQCRLSADLHAPAFPYGRVNLTGGDYRSIWLIGAPRRPHLEISQALPVR